ncbi:MAG: UDP-glucose 4-epimerase GalE [Salinibacterium sp.]|nr:UDP-glucose 4-epimerase GalE [Salinibacterium sp.]MBF0673479.1 UDP-glucose 4-epimerase GalE [Salinibacterium sp.]
MTVLVTGGAGYIGSHVVRLLRDRGETAIVVDDLSAGRAERVAGAELVQLDLTSADAIERLTEAMREFSVDAVIHFAALKAVGESVEQPARYYRHNLGSLANVLLACEAAGVEKVVFSSSAAVYGAADGPVTEDSPTQPLSPYGETKLAGEWLMAAHAHARGVKATSLRYFNVAGAGWPELGDTSVMNLVPMVLERLDAGKPPRIFGDDYNTPDGTCIRDYIHVLDLAEAHLAALDGLDRLGVGHHVFNIGTGVGSSVRQIVDAILDVSGSDLKAEVVERRAGDPDSIVATVDRVEEAIGWRAQRTVTDIVASAWAAHEHHQAG